MWATRIDFWLYQSAPVAYADKLQPNRKSIWCKQWYHIAKHSSHSLQL